MSYNPNIPVNTDFMLQSQRQILSNFQAINEVWGENHVILNDPDSIVTGWHTLLNFILQTGNPTTTADETALFTKSVGGIPALFYNPNNSQTPIQMSYPSVQTGLQSSNPDVYFANQYSFAAGPFVIFGGLLTGAVQGQLVTLLPATTLIYVGLVILNPVKPSSRIFTACATALNTPGPGQFTVQFQTAITMAQDIYYLAIGQ